MRKEILFHFFLVSKMQFYVLDVAVQIYWNWIIGWTEQRDCLDMDYWISYPTFDFVWVLVVVVSVLVGWGVQCQSQK